jgi:hypothetical protein
MCWWLVERAAAISIQFVALWALDCPLHIVARHPDLFRVMTHRSSVVRAAVSGTAVWALGRLFGIVAISISAQLSSRRFASRHQCLWRVQCHPWWHNERFRAGFEESLVPLDGLIKIIVQSFAVRMLYWCGNDNIESHTIRWRSLT